MTCIVIRYIRIYTSVYLGKKNQWHLGNRKMFIYFCNRKTSDIIL